VYPLKSEPFDLKKFILGSINRRITFLFLVVGIVAPAIGIVYFYSISLSLLSEGTEIFYQQLTILQTAAILVIFLIAIDTGIIGLFISRSISKPILCLHNATREIERGNFNIKTDIKTQDEIEQLSNAINKTAIALSKMEDQRKRIDKAKSEFLSITSHELRTPITPMKAQLQMLENGYFGNLNKKQKESLNIILRNAERLDKIIEDFLEVSRIESARLKFVFRPTNIKQTINETIGIMQGFAKEKKILLRVKAEDLSTIMADPDRLSQVLRNLIHNAIKFSNPGSTITVSAVKKNNHILFSVSDQGVGMTAKDQIRVFEPFFQIEDHLSRKHGGTGLGLAICRGIVESQKGKIWVESEVNKGSTFNFTLPLTPVEDIEPIKVLFSSKSEIEVRLKEEFTGFLGPMGIAEFNDLKNKNALGKKELYQYINELEGLCIILPERASSFKTNIGKIFGNETSEKSEYMTHFNEKKGNKEK
jgi:signal transduction histidine kinase